jgi:hypothetical protein
VQHLPFPSNENRGSLPELTDRYDKSLPWVRTGPTEPPPMMFQVEFLDGYVRSYSYADLRETRLRDAGHLQLCILGMEKYHLNIEGRNLLELAKLIGLGRIKSLTELGPRTFDRPEAAPSIDTITIETLTGPTYGS